MIPSSSSSFGDRVVLSRSGGVQKYTTCFVKPMDDRTFHPGVLWIVITYSHNPKWDPDRILPVQVTKATANTGILMVECHPQVCPAGEKCCNQLFEKRLYPPLQPYNSQTRGWGLKTLVPLKKGDFVIEYVGEIINEDEYKKRLNQMHVNNEENFYFLTIDKDRLLDAGPKGNVARFMNHSCQPNCETQKWTVNGDTRVGLFALHDIPANTELVFNYNLESIGDKKPCMCGAPNCSGFIGVKVTKNQEKDENKEKRIVKKKKSLVVNKAHEEDCFVCGEGGQLLLCDGKHCTKGYHLSCLNKKQRPQGYWLCPWHQCNVCNKGRVQRCSNCVNSYCQEHSEGNIRLDQIKGLVCSKHDPEKHMPDEKALSDEELLKHATSILPEPTPMDVDNDSSEIPSAADSNVSEVCMPKEELTNNNVVKSSTTPLRRTRRSQSNNDTVVNGSEEKVSKRRGRPSSVDEKLIISLEKTDTNCPKPVVNSCNLSSKEDVKMLLDQVIDTLPTKDALEIVSESQEITGKDQVLDIISNDMALKTNSEDAVAFDERTNIKDQALVFEDKDEVLETNCEDKALGTISKDQVLETNGDNQPLDNITEDNVLETNSEDTALKTISKDQVLETNKEDTVLETISEDQVLETNEEDTALGTVSEDQVLVTNKEDTALETIIEDQVLETNSKDHGLEITSKDQALETNIENPDCKDEFKKSCDINTRTVVSSEINRVDKVNNKIESIVKADISEEKVTNIDATLDKVNNSIDKREHNSYEKGNNTHTNTDDNTISKEEATEDPNKLSNIENKSPKFENNVSPGKVEPLVTSTDDKENQMNVKEPKTDDEEKTILKFSENVKSSVSDIIDQNLEENVPEDVDCVNNVDGDSKPLLLAVDSKEELSNTENIPLEVCSETLRSNIVKASESKCDENLAQKPEENTLVDVPNDLKSKFVTSTQVLDDDFELSYSEECSNDNVNKDVSNTESSIELKLTDYTSSKTEEAIKTQEEIKSDLTNGIEQQSATEVA